MSLRLSIVVPLFNEVDNVIPLYRAISHVALTMGSSYELIFVDDGSDDGTVTKLKAIQESDSTVRVIRFRKNFGQTPAMRAGIQAARGAAIVTLDGDLQNDPADIPKLVAKIDAGYDLAIGWRKNRKDPSLSRTLPSRIANALIGWITGVRVHDSGCSLKAYRATTIKKIPLYSEMHRFIPVMSQLQGARIAEVVVSHHPRQRGQSKYGLSRIGKVLLDVVAIKMLISFRHQPLRWFCYLAAPFLVFSTIAGSVYVAGRMSGAEPLLVSPIAFLLFTYMAVHLFCTGILAELVVRAGSRRTLRKGIKHADLRI